ncbi:MAG: hypothetical protein ABIP75_00445 [Pyrinomonadaceae bacterium]
MPRKVYSQFIILLAFSGCALLWGNSEAHSAASVNIPAAIPTPTPAMAAGRSAGFTDAQYQAHIVLLKKKFPNHDFNYVIQPPFIVIGNDTPSVVQQHAERTVKWAVDKLKQDYFTSDPASILDIWLFKDEVTYEKYAKEIFGDEPDTPYGYYSSAHQSLIMNISTGGGTLVHEIVHPFIEANFPDCPAWFNEGLGSLYEQSGEEKGHIHGYPNWRLPALQEAIRARTVPKFKDLTATTWEQFYNEDKGTNYAQSRYLLYYLQDRGLLVKYYQQFLASRRTDPTGYKTLQRILGVRDMNAFQRRWEQFVLKIERN